MSQSDRGLGLVDVLTARSRGLTGFYNYVRGIDLHLDVLNLGMHGSEPDELGMLGTLLGLKPVLQLQGEKLDAYAKVRGMAAAEKSMLKAIENDLQTRFAGMPVHIHVAYSGDTKAAQEWKKEVRKYFDNSKIELYQLPVSICCHVGAGVKAIAVTEVAVTGFAK